MSTIVRYSVWIKTDDMGEDYIDALHEAFPKLPGFVEASFEDSYEE